MGDDTDRDGAYQFDLWCQLETTIDLYEQDREDYRDLRLEIEDWSPMHQLFADADEIARLILRRASSLTNTGSQAEINSIYRVYHEELDRLMARYKQVRAAIFSKLPEDQANRVLECLRLPRDVDPIFLDDDEPLRVVWERLCIDHAWEVVGSIRDRVKRILVLERLIYEELGKAPPPEVSARFLSLVSRTYIYGFDTECVVMCRSAMEMAFREIVSETHFQRAGRRPGDGETLAELIRVAVHISNNLLNGRSDLYQAAEMVRLRANKALHADPTATSDVLGTMRSALRVITALSEAPKRS